MSEVVKSIGMSLVMKGEMADAQAAITDALKAQGFGVLTEIDVQTTLKNKIDVDFRPYKILGACNPQLAHRALSSNPEVGLLLPCNVTLSQENEGEVTISIVDPTIMLNMIDTPIMCALAEDAKERLSKALDSLR